MYPPPPPPPPPPRATCPPPYPSRPPTLSASHTTGSLARQTAHCRWAHVGCGGTSCCCCCRQAINCKPDAALAQQHLPIPPYPGTSLAVCRHTLLTVRASHTTRFPCASNVKPKGRPWPRCAMGSGSSCVLLAGSLCRAHCIHEHTQHPHNHGAPARHPHTSSPPTLSASHTTRFPSASNVKPKGRPGPRYAMGLGSSCVLLSGFWGAARTAPYLSIMIRCPSEHTFTDSASQRGRGRIRHAACSLA